MIERINVTIKLLTFIGLLAASSAFADGDAEETLDKYLAMIPEKKMNQDQAKEFGEIVFSVKDQTKRTLGMQAACCYIIKSVCESELDPEQDKVSDILLSFLKGFQWAVLLPEPKPAPVVDGKGKNLLELPNELLDHIVSRNGSKGWRGVNKQLTSLANSKIQIVLKDASELESLIRGQIRSQIQGVDPISRIKVDYRITLSELEHLVNSVSAMTHLEITDYTDYLNAQLGPRNRFRLNTLSKIPNVTLGIMIRDKKELEKFLDSANQDIARVFVQYGVLNNDNLKKLVEAYTHLTELHLETSQQLSDYLPLKSLKGLKKLRLSSGNVTDLSFLKNLPDLTTLSLLGCNNISAKGFEPISYLKNLRELNLVGCRRFGNEGLCSIAAGCPELTVLNLDNCDWVTDFQPLLKLSHLKELSLREHYDLTDENLMDQISNLTNLSVLNLHGCGKITNTGIVSLYKLKGLTSLSLGPSSSSELGFAAIDNLIINFPHLEKLTINGDAVYERKIAKRREKIRGERRPIPAGAKKEDWYSTRIREVINDVSELNRYIEKHGAEVSDTSPRVRIDYRVTLPDLKRLINSAPNITHLEVSDFTAILNAGQRSWGTLSMNLKKIPHVTLGIGISNKEELSKFLGLEGRLRAKSLLIVNVNISYKKFKDDDLKKLVKSYPNIVALTLDKCNKLSDYLPLKSLRSLKKLGLLSSDVTDISVLETLSSLASLSLKGGDNISSGGFDPICCLKELKELDLSGCKKISNNDLKLLAEGCPELTVLYLNACDSITDFVPLQKLSHLRELYLAYHFDLTDDVLRDQISRLSKLAVLSLSNCPKITIDGILSLYNANEFRFLNLRYCEGIQPTRNNIDFFIRRFPNLERLEIGSEVINKDKIKEMARK